MKARFSPILWILILVVASQGALPGVVVCFETAGKVEVEALADKCCYGDRDSTDRSAVYLFTTSSQSEPASSCGPCTDTPVSPILVIKPAENVDASVDALPSTAFPFDFAAINAEGYFVNPSVTANASLIPIETTTLLI